MYGKKHELLATFEFKGRFNRVKEIRAQQSKWPDFGSFSKVKTAFFGL